MRLPHHLLRHASGVYHFRLVVPRDLHAAIGVRVVKRSLRTRDPNIAKMAAWSLSASYALAFVKLRGNSMAKTAPPSVDELVAGLGAGTSRPYVVDRKAGIFQSDGPEDHGRAMEMMAANERLVRAETEAAAAAHARAQEDPELAALRFAEYQRFQAGTARPSITAASGFSVREMITHWETAESADMLPATAETRKEFIEEFATHFGEKRPIADVRRTDLASWDASNAKRGNTKSTRKGKASHLKMFFDAAQRTGHYPAEQRNPAEKLVKFTKGDQAARAESHGWRAFTLPELKTLFAPDNLARAREPHTRRALVIGLYTGARVGEVAQLKVTDFTTENGTKCLRIQSELKTKASKRLIPIHPDLLALGLLDWVEEQNARKQTRLFPTVSLIGKSGKGSAISKGTSNLLALLKIEPAAGETTRVGFHSFRGTVVQELQGADPDKLKEERRRAYVGHAQYEKHDNSSHALHYMRKWTPAEIAGLHGGITWGKWLDMAGLKKLLAQTDSDALVNKAKRVAKRIPTK
jgi:integrase